MKTDFAASVAMITTLHWLPCYVLKWMSRYVLVENIIYYLKESAVSTLFVWDYIIRKRMEGWGGGGGKAGEKSKVSLIQKLHNQYCTVTEVCRLVGVPLLTGRHSVY